MVCALGGGECSGQGELHLSGPGGDPECGTGGGARTCESAEREGALVRAGGWEAMGDFLSESEEAGLSPEGCR